MLSLEFPSGIEADHRGHEKYSGRIVALAWVELEVAARLLAQRSRSAVSRSMLSERNRSGCRERQPDLRQFHSWTIFALGT